MSILPVAPGLRRDVRRVSFSSLNRPHVSSDRSGSAKRNRGGISSDTSGSEKVRASSSEKASSHLATGDALQRIAAEATRARGSGKNDRKSLRFPPLRRGYANGHDGERGPSYYGDIWDYLQAWGFRILNDLQRDDLTTTADDLADLFAARVREHGRTYHHYDGRGLGLDLDTVDRLADTAAAAVLRDWTHDWIASRREAGRAGGLAHGPRKPDKATEDNRRKLASLRAEHPGWTQRQLADALDVSVSTLKRIS